MEKLSEAIGLPVICFDGGKQLGIIKDIIFSKSQKKITAFVLEKTGKEIYKKVILLKDVLNLGNDAVVIDGKDCIIQYRKVKNNNSINDNIAINGRRIYARNGNDIGVVKDVLFDYKTGIIEGVEISDGILQDIIKGRNIVPLFGRVEFGEDNILVDNEVIEEMISTGGGIGKKFLD